MSPPDNLNISPENQRFDFRVELSGFFFFTSAELSRDFNLTLITVTVFCFSVMKTI